MKKAGLLPYEKVLASNMANGHRFENLRDSRRGGVGGDYPERGDVPFGQGGRPAHRHEFYVDGGAGSAIMAAARPGARRREPDHQQTRAVKIPLPF